jgi:hypothetical protein
VNVFGAQCSDTAGPLENQAAALLLSSPFHKPRISSSGLWNGEESKSAAA